MVMGTAYLEAFPFNYLGPIMSTLLCALLLYGWKTSTKVPLNKATMAEHIQHVQRLGVFGTHNEILATATWFNIPTFYCCLSDRGQQYSFHCIAPLRQQWLLTPISVKTRLKTLPLPLTLGCCTSTTYTTTASCLLLEICVQTFLH